MHTHFKVPGDLSKRLMFAPKLSMLLCYAIPTNWIGPIHPGVDGVAISPSRNLEIHWRTPRRHQVCRRSQGVRKIPGADSAHP